MRNLLKTIYLAIKFNQFTQTMSDIGRLKTFSNEELRLTLIKQLPPEYYLSVAHPAPGWRLPV